MKNMKDMMEKMMMSPEKKGEMDKNQIQAKMDVLKELLDLAHGEMGKKVKSGMDEMKKVSVMAPDDESLKEGLDLASEILPEESEDPKEESTETPDEEKKEDELSMAKPSEDEEDDSIFNKRMKKGMY